MNELQQKLASIKRYNKQTIRSFAILKFLKDEIVAFLHSRLPDPLVKPRLNAVSYFVLSTKHEIYRSPLSQSNRLYFYLIIFRKVRKIRVIAPLLRSLSKIFRSGIGLSKMFT